ncbi:MAG TPA: hypothetical protein PKD54_11290 [Pirellulaceae bacterium]|nr:hypothetical protein [Pirellulaceae bacterium]
MARLTAPFRNLFGGDDGDGSPNPAEDSPWRLSSMISFPVRLMSALVVFFVSAWSSSRHWWPFVLGIPAMLVVVAALGAATIPPWLLRLDKKRDVLYQGRYETYLVTPEHAPYAMACALRSVDRNPGELMFKYLVGAAYQAGGDTAATQRTMSSLAPLDKPGFPRAHLWLADTELSKIGQATSEDEQESYKATARQHLDLALAKGGEDVFTVDMAVANMRLAQLYFAQKRF